MKKFFYLFCFFLINIAFAQISPDCVFVPPKIETPSQEFSRLLETAPTEDLQRAWGWLTNDKQEELLNAFDAEKKPYHRGTGGCFGAGAKVTTPNGTKNIEDFKIGDSVYSYNIEKKQLVVSKITKTFSYGDMKACDLKLENGKHIRVTPYHPFAFQDDKTNKIDYMPIGALVAIYPGYPYPANEHLQPASLLEGVIEPSSGAETVTFQPTKAVRFSDPISMTVYNIEVSENHNYIAEGMLVHNK